MKSAISTDKSKAAYTMPIAFIRTYKRVPLVATLTILLWGAILPAAWVIASNLGVTELSDGSTKLTVTDDALDFFGDAVDLDGDTAIIGAPYAETNGIDSGTAYVFTRDTNGDWSRTAKLIPEDAAENDQFGISVSIHGDTVVVGAYKSDAVGENSGAAYVFTRDTNGDWNQAAKLTPEDAEAGREFGISVSATHNTVIVGSIDIDGAAYVFSRDDEGNWNQTAKLTPNDEPAQPVFGFSVDIDGDTAIVSAHGDNVNEIANSGSVYIFKRDNEGNWNQEAKLTPDSPVEDHGFGSTLTIDNNTIITSKCRVGCWGGEEQAAYIFARDSQGNWNQQAKLLLDSLESTDERPSTPPQWKLKESGKISVKKDMIDGPQAKLPDST